MSKALLPGLPAVERHLCSKPQLYCWRLQQHQKQQQLPHTLCLSIRPYRFAAVS